MTAPRPPPQWQRAAGAWDRWGWSLQRQYGAATETMLDMAGIRPGMRVLDIAAGPGYQTVQAAARVGSAGHVLAVDIAPEMVAAARRTLAGAGLDNVTVAQVDAQALDVAPGGFDAVICRLSLMILPDARRALAGARAVLKPGGRMAAMVFAGPERNRFLSQPARIIRKRLSLPPPPPDAPGLFALADPKKLERLFRDAGYRDFSLVSVAAPQRLDSAKQHVAFLREASRALIEMMEAVPPEMQHNIWEEIERAAAVFEGADGFVGPCEVHIAAAAA